MAVYKFQATSVGYWRGNPHRWQNSFHYDISNDGAAAGCLPDFTAKIKALGTSQVPGGLASVAAYNTSTGGVPIASNVLFDYSTVASWISWSGSGPWGTGTDPTQAGEAAAKFRTQAGVGSTGKPVYVGIFWHAFTALPDTNATAQFTTAVRTAAALIYNGFQVLSISGVATAVQVTPGGRSIAGSGALLPFVESHQRTRGRRRKIVTIDGKRYVPAGGSSSQQIVPVEAA
uniref:Uncharacterized protein n=1 Tax=uncultured prokaryote TaxID=198431 RepID=A0A0H5Q3Y2_9ZZZZ|nr:hypothetical protein [uncultured prokaryote]